MNRFTQPESVRLPLSDGDYIDIKKRLNHGETEEMYARWAPFVTPGQPAQLNRREVRTAKVILYLLGWSLTNNGAPVPMSPDIPEATRLATLRNLDPDAFDEIHRAIETHEAAMTAERAAAKNGQGGETGSAAISPSPSAAAGPSETSVN